MTPDPISRLEEGIALLKRQNAAAWAAYGCGAAPLVIVSLAFFRDISSGYGERRLLPEVIACAVAFLWSAFWKGRFSARLTESLAVNPGATSSWRECVQVQLPLHALKLLVLPFAAVAVVPYPWTSGFFRAVDYESSLPGANIGRALRDAARKASHNLKQHWLACLILAAGALIAFVNVLFLLLVIPELVRSLTGLESEWTRGGVHIVNRNTIAIAVALTWLFMDPLIASYSAVRWFEAEAKTDGRDLLAAIKRLATASAMLLLLVAPVLRAAQRTSELDRNIDRIVAQDPEYSWAHQGAPADTAVTRAFDAFGKLLDRIGSAIDDFFRWLGRMLNPDPAQPISKDKHEKSSPQVWWLLSVLAALLAAGVVFAVARSGRRQNRPLIAGSPAQSAPAPDDDAALSLTRPDTEWLQLAREQAEAGDFRHAVRSLYLANLAYLGSNEWITPARAKTNGIYERELRVRDRSGAMLKPFVTLNRGYERTWFGLHDVSPDMFTDFIAQAEALRGHA